jgi:hypothetical protein
MMTSRAFARAFAKTSNWAGDRMDRPDFGGAGESSIVL